jgi:hypothetical protein
LDQVLVYSVAGPSSPLSFFYGRKTPVWMIVALVASAVWTAVRATSTRSIAVPG